MERFSIVRFGTPRTPANHYQRSSMNVEKLKVFCRLRPIEGESCVQLVNGRTIKLKMPESSVNFRAGPPSSIEYCFEKILIDSKQSHVFKTVAQPLVEKLIIGESSLLFTYGVTGSGKTYTMTGDGNGAGILPRCLNHLFNMISDSQAKCNTFKPNEVNSFEIQSEASTDGVDRFEFSRKSTLSIRKSSTSIVADISKGDVERKSFVCQGNVYSVFVTYIEIYNEEIYDLLENTDAKIFTKLQSKGIRKDDRGNMYVDGVTEIEVKSFNEASDVYRRGYRRRRVACTNLNEDSSRGHSIFTIRLVQAPLSHLANGRVLQEMNLSQLSLVDLAGSERANRTENRNQRLKESGRINNSLMTLRTCLERLRENQRTGNAKMISRSRESKLTRLLENFLEGEGDIRMVVCVNPSIADYDETIHVLEFAEISQKIQVKPTPNRNQVFQTKKMNEGDGKVLLLSENRKASSSFNSNQYSLSEENVLEYIDKKIDARCDKLRAEIQSQQKENLNELVTQQKETMKELIELQAKNMNTFAEKQQENFFKLQQDYEAVNARRERNLLDTMRGIEEKLFSVDENTVDARRRCEQYEFDLKRFKQEVEEKNRRNKHRRPKKIHGNKRIVQGHAVVDFSATEVIYDGNNNENTNDETSYRENMSTEPNEVKLSNFKCKFCLRIYQRQYHWKKHMEQFHNRFPSNFRFKCDTCKRSFAHETQLKKHASICKWIIH